MSETAAAAPPTSEPAWTATNPIAYPPTPLETCVRCGAVRPATALARDDDGRWGCFEEDRNGRRIARCTPPAIHPDRTVDPRRLVAGQAVYRYTEPSRRGLTAELPCHEQQLITVTDRDVEQQALCRRCGTGYDLVVLDDGDGGHYAHFTVTSTPILLSRGRRTHR